MCQVSFSEPGLLSSVRDTKVASTGLSRERPASPLRHGGRAWTGRQLRHGGRRKPTPISACERLEHAGGFLAARHAEVQPLFFLVEQRVGVLLAVVAALAAILLAHRRHHLAAQRLAVGELHALGERQGLVVPGRAVVGLDADIDARHQRRRILRRQRRDVAVQQAGEKAVEPDALLGGERRVLRHDRCKRRAQRRVHAPALREQLPAAPRRRAGG